MSISFYKGLVSQIDTLANITDMEAGRQDEVDYTRYKLSGIHMTKKKSYCLDNYYIQITESINTWCSSEAKFLSIYFCVISTAIVLVLLFVTSSSSYRTNLNV